MGAPSLLWSNPWLILAGALVGIFTVVLAVELVIALVKQGSSADLGEGDL